MKIGLSLYSLSRELRAHRLDPFDAIDWIADNGGEQVEIAPSCFDSNDPAVMEALKKRMDARGLAVSSYSFGANFIVASDEQRTAEIARVKKEIDKAAFLGAQLVRHDVAYRPLEDTMPANFELDLPIIATICGEIADYAAAFGITTSVENHGYHFQGSERIQRLLRLVNRANFKTTLDVGNFLCVDENPTAGVAANIGFASMVHFKDFLIRPASHRVGEGWFPTRAGNHLRGTIVGDGDIDLETIAAVITNSGYDGFVSVEFEGPEDCFEGSRRGMANARRLLEH